MVHEDVIGPRPRKSVWVNEDTWNMDVAGRTQPALVGGHGICTKCHSWPSVSLRSIGFIRGMKKLSGTWSWVFLKKANFRVLITFLKNENEKSLHVQCVALLKLQVTFPLR